MKKKKVLSKDERISEEQKRLSKIFKNIGGDKQELCFQLIQNASFMYATLLELQQTINENGAIEAYQNGPDQSGTRIAPAAQIYTKLIANYNAVIKQLLSLLPPSEKELAKIGLDPMAEFLNSK